MKNYKIVSPEGETIWMGTDIAQSPYFPEEGLTFFRRKENNWEKFTPVIFREGDYLYDPLEGDVITLQIPNISKKMLGKIIYYWCSSRYSELFHIALRDNDDSLSLEEAIKIAYKKAIEQESVVKLHPSPVPHLLEDGRLVQALNLSPARGTILEYKDGVLTLRGPTRRAISAATALSRLCVEVDNRFIEEYYK